MERRIAIHNEFSTRFEMHFLGISERIDQLLEHVTLVDDLVGVFLVNDLLFR